MGASGSVCLFLAVCETGLAPVVALFNIMTAVTSDYLAALATRVPKAPRQAPRDGLHALLARMGHPERRLRCIHIAGSKGKGSTALMLEAMLRAGGRTTGVFTSPHLEHWNERIRINGEPVDDDVFDAIIDELKPHVAAVHAHAASGPVFFEVLLVAALCLFERAGVQEPIVEAGIGARFDATRVVQAVATALISVELEHTDLLGTDLAAIAHDKGAVARPGVPLVIGALPPAAHAVVAKRAAEVDAPLIEPQARLVPDGSRVVMDNGVDLPLPAPSHALAQNAVVAFACLQTLGLFDDADTVARQGMASLVLPGRLEVLAREPLVVADGAHTRASIAALSEALHAWGLARAPLHLVLSCSGARDLPALLSPLLLHACGIVLTRADATRSADPASLAAALRPHCAERTVVQVIETPKAALAAALARAPAHGIVCATGSVYMAGAARCCIRSPAGV